MLRKKLTGEDRSSIFVLIRVLLLMRRLLQERCSLSYTENIGREGVYIAAAIALNSCRTS